MGQGLAKATGQVRAKVRTGATLRPCPGFPATCQALGSPCRARSLIQGAVTPIWERLTLLHVEPGLNSLSRVSKGPLPGTGLRWRHSTLPTTSEAECPTQCLQREGGRTEAGEGGQRGPAGPEEGAHSRAQRRPRPSGSRSPGRWAQGPSSVAGALLQRLREQHCLMILLKTWCPTDHSCFMLVLGHLGAQRLLTNIIILDSAQRDEKTWGPAGCYPCGQS